MNTLRKSPLFPVACLAAFALTAHAQNVLLEAEQCADTGGWDVDQQFMEQMGSSYLLAHGLGVPVKAAEWHWHDGGNVAVGSEATVALHDLTGFEGRCDAVLFSKDPKFVPPNDLTALASLVGEPEVRQGDFLEDHRLVEALRSGVAPDYDVYDAATWSSIAVLSEQSVADRSRPVDFPDFTKGKWKTTTPIKLMGV